MSVCFFFEFSFWKLEFHFPNWRLYTPICILIFGLSFWNWELHMSILVFIFGFSFWKLEFHFEKNIFEFPFWKCGLHMSIWISIFGFSFWKLKFYFESWFLFLNFHFENSSSICVYLFLFLDFYFEAWSFIGQGHEGKLMALASVWFSIFIFQCSTNNYALRVLLKFFTLNFKNTLAKRQPQSTATGHSREFPSGSGSHWFGSYMKGETNAKFLIFHFFTLFR